MGPLLYNIYLYDIDKCLHSSKFLLYADDKKIFTKIASLDDCLSLQNDLNRLTNYYNINKISVNINKCQKITFSRNKKNIINFEYSICNEKIPSTNTVRDLGVILDEKLTYNDHIDYVTNKAFANLGFVLRTAEPFDDIRCLKVLYFAYVRSILEFACVIWRPIYKCYINRLEKIQKIFFKKLNFKSKHFPVSYEQACLHYNINALSDRRDLIDVMFLFDILNNKFDCISILNPLNFRVPSQGTRQKNLFLVPSTSTNYLKNSPYFRLPEVYNNKFCSADIFCLSRPRFKSAILQIINNLNK
ncbi:uncharacterized protein LOC123693467 [Colias croceus]|uniref:uncharacterized protein LOC123693467 n=1 Tax=Colias crocea TaxID=72248 RepID=UPI001E27BED8|nr:uncharacterized protein LOC123693467 [Colias croceus]